VFYFRQVPLISESKVVEILEVYEMILFLFSVEYELDQVLCKCLDDEIVEVREMAAT
jgi:hypothetical protein